MALLRFQEAKSSRGKTLLTNSGYEYTWEALSKVEDGWEYWRCPRRPPYCPGRAAILIGWQVDNYGEQYKEGRITGEHNHPPTLGVNLVKEAAEKLHQEARSDFPTTSRNIVREVRSSLPVEVRANSAPSAANMQWSYNYQKRRQQEEVGDVGLDVLPTSEIVIPFRMRERVIFDQMHQGQRMIVFFLQFGINSLANFRNEVAIDGTFETCPRGFAQLYAMSVIIDHCAIPVVYGLLSNKNVGAYTQFFEAIRNAVAPDWNPNRMMSDFEAAALNAASAVFPNTFRSGCLFHLGQCIFRRIQRLPQLYARYNADDASKSLFVHCKHSHLCRYADSLRTTRQFTVEITYCRNHSLSKSTVEITHCRNQPLSKTF